MFSYEYNNENIIVGYIKELLHDFNLPECKVYTDDVRLIPDRLYIKSDGIYKCVSNDSGYNMLLVQPYNYGLKLANVTKNMVINSSTYDTYTHQYLGDYLRFIRDMNGLNLMPLYNCYTNEQAKDLNYIVYLVNETTGKSREIRVITTDRRYCYYLAKVKFDQIYTIGIDAQTPYELFCILNTGDAVLPLSKLLTIDSYTMVLGSSFSQPIIYSTKFNDITNYWRYEDTLNLVIKVPRKVESTITVLEGNYLNCCSVLGNILTPQEIVSTDIDYKLSNQCKTQILTKLSLLSCNNKHSYPFADRLVEYLLGNAITSEDKIYNNILNVLTIVYNDKEAKSNKFVGYSGIWDNNLLYRLREIREYNCKINMQKLLNIDSKKGDNLRPYYKNKDLYYDMLDFVDKDLEHILRAIGGK